MSPARNAPILYVENDPDDAFLLETAFKRCGAPVEFRVADTGQNAIAYLSGVGPFADRVQYPLPRVVLLDWNMPMMSGGQFLEWIRSQPMLRHVPVIVFTSSENPSDLRAAYDRGANGFMTKPSNQRDLQALAAAFARYWLDWNRTGPQPSLS